MSADARPVFDHVNVVVHDMDAALAFYARLGVEIAPTVPPWDRHHRYLETPAGAGFDLDSASFATKWDAGWPPGQSGVVLVFRVATREAVDETYADLTGGGYEGSQPPWDAFWGSRFAVVLDPDGNHVGIMSPRDLARQAPAPNPE